MVVNGGSEITIAVVQVLALAMGSFALSLAPTVTSIRLSLCYLIFFAIVVGLSFEEGFALVLV